MTGPPPAHLFRNRHRLGVAELSWAARRLAMVDGHHVAKVHGRHGVIDGFELSVEAAPGGALVVSPGHAWTPCGDLVTVDCTTRIPPPSEPGAHGIWLEYEGRVITRASRLCDPPAALRLGSARAAVRAPHGRNRIHWVASSVTTDGRLWAVAAERAHVASGREQLSLADLDIDVDAHTVGRRVVTTNGLFERTPLYFATFGLDAALPDSAVDGAFGWFLEICSAEPTAFTARVHVQLRDHMQQIEALRDQEPDLVVDLAWMGVDPDRPDVVPADPLCSAIDRPPPIELI